MDIVTSAPTFAQHSAGWDTILAEVNAWRGACVHHFSAVEMAVNETLLALSNASPDGAAVGLRHLIGQRLEDVTAATGPGGPFQEAGRNAQAELVQYRENHEEFRNQLCHGFVKVAVERNGNWILVLRVTAFRSGKAVRNTLVIDQNEALARLDALKRDANKLSSVLGQLRKTVNC